MTCKAHQQFDIHCSECWEEHHGDDGSERSIPPTSNRISLACLSDLVRDNKGGTIPTAVLDDVIAELERLTRELAQAKAGFTSLNDAHEALRQRFARACAEVTRLSGEPASAHETYSRQAPIARVKVAQDRCYTVELYAPGLPPGDHDLYCEPESVAPMMRRHEGATPLAKIADKLDTAEDLTDCERGCAADALRKLADADVRHVRLRQYRMPARELPDDDVPESPEKACDEPTDAEKRAMGVDIDSRDHEAR